MKRLFQLIFLGILGAFGVVALLIYNGEQNIAERAAETNAAYATSRTLALPVAAKTSTAAALTTEHRNLARNLAMLAYAERRCPQLRINALMLAQGVTAYGLPMSAIEPGSAIFDEAKTEKSRLDAHFGPQSDDQVCAFMEDGFGPGGTIASGFLKRR